MRKTISALILCAVLGGSVSGCATWWENFKKDPVAQTQTILSTINTIINVAQMVFGQVKPFMSVADQQDAQVAFDKALTAVQHSENLIQQAVQTAVEQKKDLDLAKLFQDAQKSVDDLQALINLFKSKQTVTVGTAVAANQESSQDLLGQQVGLLRRQTADAR